MIVRDNSAIIEECLTSVRPWVDEMIVVDTGSVDETPAIARRMGARLATFPWIDDFSAARNASIDLARGEWVFWMDSDDVIDAECGRNLRRLVTSSCSARTLGFVMQVHCPGVAGVASGDITVVDHVKVFRNHPQLRFEGRIHEQILPAIRRLDGEIEWTTIFVTHKHGAVSDASKIRKHERDLRILTKDLSERGEHPFVLFNLGMTYCDMEQYGRACEFLSRSIRAAETGESHLSKAYALLIACYLQLEDLSAASRLSEEATKLFPEDAEIRFRFALTAQQSKNWDVAERTYRRLLRYEPNDSESPRRFSSCDVGIRGHKARHNLALVLTEKGDWEEAEYQWRLAIDEAPCFQPAIRSLGLAFVRNHRFRTARETAERWLQRPELRLDGHLLKSKVSESDGDHAQALTHLDFARQEFPHRSEPLDESARILFALGNFQEAKEMLVQLAELCPMDAAIAHNLGNAYLATGNKAEAKRELQRSLRLRPNSPMTEQLLALTD